MLQLLTGMTSYGIGYLGGVFMVGSIVQIVAVLGSDKWGTFYLLVGIILFVVGLIMFLVGGIWNTLHGIKHGG